MGEHAGVRRARHSAGRRGGGKRPAPPGLWGDGAVSGGRCLGGEGDRSNRGGDDAGAHARHMRRRTPGLRQWTFAPRPISRLSSASLPSFAACHNFLSFESLIASAALIRPSPARPPADSGGARARLRGDAREAAARTPSRCACSSPTRPSELGWRRQPWREGASRTLEATKARSRGCRNAWLPRLQAAWYGRAKQLWLPGPRTCAMQAIGLDEGIGRASRKRSPQSKRAASHWLPEAPKAREACRADAHGNRPPSQLVVNPARRVSGRERSEGRMER